MNLVNSYRQFLRKLVAWSGTNPSLVLGLSLFGAALLLIFTSPTVELDTNPDHLLSPTLPFREQEEIFHHLFPQLFHPIVVVIDSPDVALTEEMTAKLTKALQGHPDLFNFIYRPDEPDFFKHYGLLYLKTSELWRVADHLISAEPLIGSLAQDPTLRGLFTLLDRILGEDLDSDRLALLYPILDGLSRTLQGQLSDHPLSFSWDSVMSDISISQDRSTRKFILAQPRLDYERLDAGGHALDTIRKHVRQLQKEGFDAVRVRLTGPVAMEDEELGSVLSGITFAMILSFFLVGTILVVGLGSLQLVMCILIPLIITLAWTAAFAFLAIGKLNVMSMSFPVFIIGLGVDFGIQFASRYREEIGQGKLFPIALQETVDGIGSALTLAAASAAVTFFSFIPTSFVGMADLGLIAGGGIIIAFFANLTVLPACLSWISSGYVKEKTLAPTLAPSNHWIVKTRSGILLATAITVLASFGLMPWIAFEFDALKTGDPNTEAIATLMELRQDPTTTPYTISVLTDGVRSADRVAEALDQLAEVDKTITLSSFLPDDQDEKSSILDEMQLIVYPILHPEQTKSPPSIPELMRSYESVLSRIRQRSESAKIPELKTRLMKLSALLQQLKGSPGWPIRALPDLEKALLSQFPAGLNTLQTLLSAKPLSLRDLPPGLMERYLAKDGQVRVEVFPSQDVSNYHNLKQFVGSVQMVAQDAVGAPVAFIEGGQAVITACLQSAVITLMGVIPLIRLSVGSARSTGLVLLPLTLTIPLTLGACVVLGIPLTYSNLIALPLIVGLGLAFGTYFVLRLHAGLTLQTLLHTSTPKAILLSALTTIGSFGTLGISSHQGIASIGRLLTVSLSIALFCNLIVLPAMLSQQKDNTFREP